MKRAVILLPCLAALALPASVTAQSLGTFRWQLQPYCNLLTVTVTQVGALYRVEGTDDQCGAGRDRAAVQGLAFQNPDGTIGFGLTIVTAPGGAAVHVDAEISLASLSGTWRSPGGIAGTFTFTPGAPAPGSPRPVAASAVPAAITLHPGGSLVARPDGDSGIPASGPGTRMMWYAGKAAFRAGRVGGAEWDDANVGSFSTALGSNTRAVGGASLASGFATSATGTYSTSLGRGTIASGDASTALGYDTVASGPASTALGSSSFATGVSSTALGSNTTASGLSAVASGSSTKAAGTNSLAGGLGSEANGYATLAFGLQSVANGNFSIALGNNAVTTAAALGSFVFADNTGASPFTSFAPNEFVVRAAGGVGFYTNAAATTGAEMAPGGGSFAALSDANMKENFREVSGEDVLVKLAQMPVREWNYTSQDPDIRHMGPTAQDFRAAFGLGDFPLRINTTDADGVALVGVKALEARTRALGEENAALRAALDELRQRLDALAAGRQPQ